jgi:hypothetical protein
MITLDGMMQAPGGPKKIHRAISNIAGGRHIILMKVMGRLCNEWNCNLQIIFWVENI